MRCTFNKGHYSTGTVGRHPAVAERADRLGSQEAYSLLRGWRVTTIMKARQSHPCRGMVRHNEVSADGEKLPLTKPENSHGESRIHD